MSYQHVTRSLPDGGDAVRRLYDRLVRQRGDKAKASPAPAAPLALSDVELLDKARQAKNGSEFAALYDAGDWRGLGHPSQSEGDQALANKLAFWLGNDAARMDAAFRASALMRDKWDRSVGRGETHGQRCIRKAIEVTQETYTPPREKASQNGNSNAPPAKVSRLSQASLGSISEEDEQTWPEVLPLDFWDTPSPPVGLMPETLEQMADAVSKRNQTPRDNPQAIATGCVSAATHGQYSLSIDGRPENLALFIGIGADSAERKSADLTSLTAPLREVEAEARELHHARQAELEAEAEMLEHKRDALKRRHTKTGEDILEELTAVVLRLKSIGSTKARRFLCQDVTPERVASLLAEQGAVALMSAEGGPLEAVGGKYSGRREVANVYMQGFSGETLTYDRQSGAAYVAENPSLTMVVMSQPVHLCGIMADPLFTGRGLLERFLWIFGPTRAGYREVGQRNTIPEHLEASYRQTLRNLLPTPHPIQAGKSTERTLLTISAEAKAPLNALESFLEPQYRPDGDLYHVRAWAGRLPTLAAKVAALWHLWDCASRRQPIERMVAPKWVANAAEWVKAYVLPMGLKAWGMLGADPSTELARQVLAAFAKSQATTLTAREIQRAKRNLTAEQVERGLKLLEARGYVRRQSHTPSRGGRASESVTLNPLFKSEPLGQTGQPGHTAPAPITDAPTESQLSQTSRLSQGSISENGSSLATVAIQGLSEALIDDILGENWEPPL